MDLQDGIIPKLTSNSLRKRVMEFLRKASSHPKLISKLSDGQIWSVSSFL